MDLAALAGAAPQLRAHPLDGALLFFDPRRGLNVRIDGPATRGLRRQAPRTLLFAITNRCNLACSFCSRDAGAASGWDEASAHAALVEFAAGGVLEVAFGGGEPLAFRGFDRLLERLRRDTELALHVTTNGTLLTPERARRLAERCGEVRVSIYEEAWPARIDPLVRAGATVGANVLCTPERLASLPELLRRLADRGVHDVALLRYVGPDAALHLDDDGEARLAEAILGSPLRARVATCFGDRLHAVPRLWEGGCGAGSEFMTVTADRRIRGCSFHEVAIPFGSAAEALAIYRAGGRGLEAPAGRRGCARPTPARAPLADGVRVWRGFGGNNSGDCVLVGRFEDAARAAAFMAELVPGFQAGRPFSQAWIDLLRGEGITSEGYSPDTMATLGQVVMLHTDSTLADDFVPLRALLWRRGGRLVFNGIHVHDSLHVVAGVRGGGGGAESAMGAIAEAGLLALGRQGDMAFGSASIGGPAGTPCSVATRVDALRAAAGRIGGQAAAEVVAWPATPPARARALPRQRAGAERPEWLWVRFGEVAEAEGFVRDLAPDLREPPARVGGAVLARFERVSPRLGWLASRRGGTAVALQGARLEVTLHVAAADPPDSAGRSERLVGTLRAFLPGVDATIEERQLGAGRRVAVRTTDPLAVLRAAESAAIALGLSLGHVGVRAAAAVPAALARVIRELRSGRR